MADAASAGGGQFPLTDTVWERIDGVVLPGDLTVMHCPVVAVVLQLPGELPVKGLTKGAAVGDVGAEEVTVVPAVALDTSRISQVRILLTRHG